MKSTNKSVEDLFLKSVHMNPEEVDVKFKSIMKKSEKAVDLSGKY